MAERPSGYYWVRWHKKEIVAFLWADGGWWLAGSDTPEPDDEVEILYGPIPGPEELKRLVGEKEAGR